jgi:hypothetical protein
MLSAGKTSESIKACNFAAYSDVLALRLKSIPVSLRTITRFEERS